ncbi:MAG: hypothetical protein AAGA56_04275, partial [Myxococcota bacterium]
MVRSVYHASVNSQRVLLAAEGRVTELRDELGPAAQPLRSGQERLWRCDGAAATAAVWAQDEWLEPIDHHFASIKDAADHLRSIQRNWSLIPTGAVRRSRLIEARLPPLRRRRWRFGDPVPPSPMGAFTLLDPETMVYSARTRSPFPAGELRFEEDRKGP